MSVKNRRLPSYKSTKYITHVSKYIEYLFVVSTDKFYSASFSTLNRNEIIVVDIAKKSEEEKVQCSEDMLVNRTYDITMQGRVKDIIPGVPEDITSVFRYIDGSMYFFRNNTFYKYNKFRMRVLEAALFNWIMFGILCPNAGLLIQSTTLLTKLIDLY